MQQLTEPQAPAPKKPRQTKLAPQPKATASPIQAARKAKKPPKLKLTEFDHDVLKLVMRGIKGSAEITGMLGIDAQEAAARFTLLEQAGLLKIGKAATPTAGELTLTIKAYNEFHPPSLELSIERKANARAKKAAARTLTQADPAQSQPPARLQPTPVPTHENPANPHSRIDLMEMLAKGAPKLGEVPAQARNSEIEITATPKPVAARQLPSQAPAGQAGPKGNASDSCQLCKGEFKLSLVGGNGKYGHCFCGAAYHKDCYEGILEADGKCVSCGRKLDLVMQKETRDEIRKLKSVFDE